MNLRRRLQNDDLRGWVAILPVALVLLTGWILARATDLFGGDGTLQSVAALLVGWNVYCASYLALTWLAYAHLDSPALHTAVRTQRTLRGVGTILSFGGHLSWATLAAFAAVAGVLVVMAASHARSLTWVQLLAALAVASSWCLLAATMALAYARVSAPGTDSPIDLHGVDDPVFADYLSTSMMVSAGLSAPSATFSGRPAIGLLRTHMVTAFVFNTVAVALLVAVILSAFG